MYFLSSFFNQFGPNAVTFLMAAEVYPTAVRASAHGFSACVGKSGALLASVVYNYIPDTTKFYFVPWFGLLGMLLTLVFIPDTTGLDLKEQERRWAYIRDGREAEYHGIAVHPQHLSLWERVVLKAGKNYNPELDRQGKIADMRADWEAKEAEKAAGGTDLDAFDDDYSDHVQNYFKATSSPGPKARTDSDEISNEKPAAV